MPDTKPWRTNGHQAEPARVEFEDDHGFIRWQTLVHGYANAVLGYSSIDFDRELLRKGYRQGMTPAEFCDEAACHDFASIASSR